MFTINTLFSFSPGDLIVSSADDCTMRIWDTTTGAELVTITSLPGSILPDKSENQQQLLLHPVNPCCFSPSGEFIASGTELGDVMLWDNSGIQVTYRFCPMSSLNSKAIIIVYLCFLF